jgi:hypothetical protein
MSVVEIHTHLRELRAERALAELDGFGTASTYMAALDDEIAAAEAAYVRAAVTEIASLRGELSGPLVG